jgi:hypothetical protein
MLHHTKPRGTLGKYAEPYWATLYPLSCALHYWATVYPAELGCIPVGLAHQYWATLNPGELRCTLLSYTAPCELRCTLTELLTVPLCNPECRTVRPATGKHGTELKKMRIPYSVRYRTKMLEWCKTDTCGIGLDADIQLWISSAVLTQSREQYDTGVQSHKMRQNLGDVAQDIISPIKFWPSQRGICTFSLLSIQRRTFQI